MYRSLLPTGIVVLLASALAFAAQVRQETPTTPTPPHPATNPQRAETPEKGVAPLEKAPANRQAQQRRGGKRVYLGVFTVPVEDMSGRTRKKMKLPNGDGVFVIEVMPHSPAEEAGLRHGDVITHVNGKLIEDEEELVDDLHQVGAGKRVDLCVIRDGKKQEIKAKLDEIPSRAIGGGAAPDEAEDEVIGMCEQNAEKIQHLERKISRLEKRLEEMEKSRSVKSGQR